MTGTDKLSAKRTEFAVRKVLLTKTKSENYDLRKAAVKERQDIKKFVKTMRSNFSSSKETKIPRQMNRSQKLKRKNTGKQQIKPHRCHPGL